MSSVVIGANFGDEGKGLITDFEVRRLEADSVARFNGGAQAGHTVQDGTRRHVFGHFGAGTFAGAGTILGSDFIMNPMIYKEEKKTLDKFGVDITVQYAPNAIFTTIYDMAINSIVETARGIHRHGSCGMGINETVVRSANSEFSITGDTHSGMLAAKLEHICSQYVPHRLNELREQFQIDPIDGKYGMLFNSRFTNFRAMAQMMLLGISHRAAMRLPNEFIKGSGVVFEGAQGLMLDEFLGQFPHVTRSVTGLPGAIALASKMGIHVLSPIYVTRAYLTRHGAGSLIHEGPISATVVDNTNQPNEWQGKLRFAPLNLAELKKFITADLDRSAMLAATHGIHLYPATLALTCMDQMADQITYTGLDGAISIISKDKFPAMVASELGMKISHISYGPEHKDVKAFF